MNAYFIKQYELKLKKKKLKKKKTLTDNNWDWWIKRLDK